MGDQRIHVEEEGLYEFRKALETAGEDYKVALAKLTNFIAEITSGDIQGDIADDLKAKFDDKEHDFNSLQTAIDEAEKKVGVKGTVFVNMIDDLKNTADRRA